METARSWKLESNSAKPIFQDRFREIRFQYSPECESLYAWLAPNAGPRFTWTLLDELNGVLQELVNSPGTWNDGNADNALNYIVLCSIHPRFFSLGGDLRVFRECIGRGDREALQRYSVTCMKMIYRWASAWRGHLTTIALVQGRALGGGFETALGAEYIVAEEHAEFGFPEILFGLFPASGAFSLLSRRISPPFAERMMTDGKIYKARELLALGLIDIVCPSGAGLRTVREFIDNHAKHRSARLALQRARARMAPLDIKELETVVGEWVEAALGLSGRNLQMIDWLIKAQNADAW